jgi:AcrR family transcriptional regulator
MPTHTFFALPAARRDRLVEEAIVEFSERAFSEASLSEIARRAKIAKGSFYQYFADKLDLYRWLVTDEAPRRKREFLARRGVETEFWAALETTIERGMAFLVEHPRLARLTAAAADPSAIPEVRGLHKAICDAGRDDLRALLQRGIASGAIPAAGLDVDVATRLVGNIIGPALTELILDELGAELHEVLASEDLSKRLGRQRRVRLAKQAVRFIRGGLGEGTSA